MKRALLIVLAMASVAMGQATQPAPPTVEDLRASLASLQRQNERLASENAALRREIASLRASGSEQAKRSESAGGAGKSAAVRSGPPIRSLVEVLNAFPSQYMPAAGSLSWEDLRYEAAMQWSEHNVYGRPIQLRVRFLSASAGNLDNENAPIAVSANVEPFSTASFRIDSAQIGCVFSRDHMKELLSLRNGSVINVSGTLRSIVVERGGLSTANERPKVVLRLQVTMKDCDIVR